MRREDPIEPDRTASVRPRLLVMVVHTFHDSRSTSAAAVFDGLSFGGALPAASGFFDGGCFLAFLAFGFLAPKLMARFTWTFICG